MTSWHMAAKVWPADTWQATLRPADIWYFNYDYDCSSMYSCVILVTHPLFVFSDSTLSCWEGQLKWRRKTRRSGWSTAAALSAAETAPAQFGCVFTPPVMISSCYLLSVYFMLNPIVLHGSGFSLLTIA